MTDLDASASNSGSARRRNGNRGRPRPVLAPLAGDPAMLGLPTFIVGSVALGLVLVGVVPASAVGASLPIILAATSTGLFIATIWSAAIGQSAVASIFGIFAGFWLSYAVLVLGFIRGWFGITVLAAAATQELFLISWLVIVVVLTLVTLRLPLAFTVIFALVDVALLLGARHGGGLDRPAEDGRLRRAGLRRGRRVRVLRRSLAGHRRQGRQARQAGAELEAVGPGAIRTTLNADEAGHVTRSVFRRACECPGLGAVACAGAGEAGPAAGGCPPTRRSARSGESGV